jgi:hypothetical protein
VGQVPVAADPVVADPAVRLAAEEFAPVAVPAVAGWLAAGLALAVDTVPMVVVQMLGSGPVANSAVEPPEGYLVFLV